MIEADHLPTYPDATLWLRKVHVKIFLVDRNATPVSGIRPIIKVVAKKTRVSDANMQKKFLSEYDLRYKIKSQKWAKLTVDKKVLMTIICRQCNHVIVAELALGSTYAADCDL